MVHLYIKCYRDKGLKIDKTTLLISKSSTRNGEKHVTGMVLTPSILQDGQIHISMHDVQRRKAPFIVLGVLFRLPRECRACTHWVLLNGTSGMDISVPVKEVAGRKNCFGEDKENGEYNPTPNTHTHTQARHCCVKSAFWGHMGSSVG